MAVENVGTTEEPLWVALADVGVTEWRLKHLIAVLLIAEVALADVGVTEWRSAPFYARRYMPLLHSLM